MDTSASDQTPDPSNPWLFTDVAARTTYAFAQRLGVLRDDIQTNVLFDGQWAHDELTVKAQIALLLKEKRIIPKGTSGYISPHPTVYRAVADGTVCFATDRQVFHSGDDLVFMPWLQRTMRPRQTGPLYIGHLQSIGVMFLTCDAFPASGNWCGQSRRVRHGALYPGSLKQGV